MELPNAKDIYLGKVKDFKVFIKNVRTKLGW